MRYAICLFVFVGSVMGARVLFFNPNSSPVTGRVTHYTETRVTNAPNSLVNPVLPDVPLQWAKVTNGRVVEMSALESNAVVAADVAAAIAARRDSAKDIFDGDGPEGRVLRAVTEIMFREINTLRVAAGLPPRTAAQARAAIRSELDSQP